MTKYRGKYPEHVQSVFTDKDQRCIIVLNNGDQYVCRPKMICNHRPQVGESLYQVQLLHHTLPRLAADRTLRTQKLINHFRGCPGEFDMLKGVLCVDHVLEYSSVERKQWDATLDISMIAERMDEIATAASVA